MLPFLFALLTVAPAPAPRVPLVLISIDGLHPDYVRRADALGLRIPNLRRLWQEGASASAVTGVTPTVTYPSHTTILTGVAPAVHGIAANTTFDPLLRNQAGWYWYAEDIRVPTLWSAAAAAGRGTANVHWPVSVGAPVRWNLPQVWRTGTADDRKLLRALATPGLLDALERDLGPFADGIDESVEADEVRGRFAARLLERHHPGFLTTYFAALDHVSHEHAPFSPEALATLERIDAIVGAVRAAAERSGGGRAIVAVVSDHGFVRTEHDLNLGVALAANGFLRFSEGPAPKATEWTAMAWPAGGSAAIVLKDTSDATLRARVGRMLDSLAADSGNGIARVLGADELRRRQAFPGASWLVELRPGWKLAYAFAGPLVTPAPGTGMHGFLPERGEMDASFAIAGPGIPAGRDLGRIDMRDIAPTLAGRMGALLPTAEGRDLLGTPAAASRGRGSAAGARPASRAASR